VRRRLPTGGNIRSRSAIDLEEAFVVGDQLDPFDSPKQRVGRYPEIARRLYGASIGLVAKPTEESGDAICVIEDLNVLGSEFKIVLIDDGYPFLLAIVSGG
jgi:hypothetical protein